MVYHLEARGLSKEQVWSLRRRSGFKGLWVRQYGGRLTQDDAWHRLCDAWEDARRTRLEFRKGRGPRPLTLLAAAVCFLRASHFKIFAACIDAARNGKVSIGQTRLEEQAGIGSHTTTREATDWLIHNGWLHLESQDEMWIARTLRLAIPRGIESKLEDIGPILPPGRGGVVGGGVVGGTGSAGKRIGRARAGGARSPLADLRVILRSNAIRQGGLSAAAAQLIIADSLGVPRSALPFSTETRNRQIRIMQDAKILDKRSFMTRDWRDRLNALAIAGGLDRRAENQRGTNESHQVAVAARVVRAARDPAAELATIRRLKGRLFANRVRALLEL